MAAGALSPADLYARLGSEWEHYDSLIWQFTTALGTATVAIGGIILTQLESDASRAITLVATVAILWSVRTGLVKHQYFLAVRSRQLEALERQFFVNGVVAQRWTITADEPTKRLIGRPFMARRPHSSIIARAWHRVFDPQDYSAIDAVLLVSGSGIGAASVGAVFFFFRAVL